MSATLKESPVLAHRDPFPLDRWYVGALSRELTDHPLSRTLLDRPIVLFRQGGQAAALEDRCCHRSLPLSCGTVEERGLRCGYHGLLYDASGSCVEVPGQLRIPSKAKVRAYRVSEIDHIIWLWLGSTPDSEPPEGPPRYRWHDDPRYKFDGDVYHYDAPWQLIHDNLLDLSHLGYVHLKTIGGNAAVHMNASIEVSNIGDTVRVTRHMPASAPPPTYANAWPFKGLVDRWQEVDFNVSHINIWAGGMDVGTGALDDPEREGLHIRGFHAITPETRESSHYFWTVSTNPHPDMPDTSAFVVQQSRQTFDEDKDVIESQYRNLKRFGDADQIDIHVDVGPNKARRVIDRLTTPRSKTDREATNPI